jgi:hypothetical protein
MFLFVDDIQGSYHITDTVEWKEIKELINRFRTKDMGESKWILGMRIERDRVKGTITLDQELYATKALEKFHLSSCTIATTPELSVSDPTNEGEMKLADRDLYMEIVGTLLYAAISTRPDITHAVQKLTRHLQLPYSNHMVAAERVLRYLAGTKSWGLTFGSNKTNHTQSTESIITAYADADWANDKVDRKSITGWVTKVNGDVISWASKKQRTTAQSTCEAELYAEAAAINEVLWTLDLLTEMGIQVQTPVVVYGDNQSTIAISQNGVKSERTKHVDIKYHFVNEMIEKEFIKLIWIQSDKQQADIFTKGLAKPLFEHFRNELMFNNNKQQ